MDAPRQRSSVRGESLQMLKVVRMAGLLALATMAMAATTQDTFTLRRALKEGQVDVYTQSMVMNQSVDASAMGGPTQDMEITQSSTMSFKTGKMDEDGKKAALSIDVEDIKIEADGMAQMMMTDQMPKEYTITGKVDARNLISDLKVDGMPAMLQMFSGGAKGMASTMNYLVFPEQAVKVGDTWDMKLPKSPVYGDTEPVFKATFKEIKDVKGVKAAVITVKGDLPMNMNIGEMMKDSPDAGPMGQMNMIMKGTVKTTTTVSVDVATGRLLLIESKSESDMELEMVDMGAKLPISGTVTMKMALKE